MLVVPRPAPGEFPAPYATYIDRVPGGELEALLADQGRELAGLLAEIPEARGGFRYAPGKWSIKDLVNHLADAERVFSYRLLRIARKDATPLPGFEEDDFAAAAGADARSLADLAAEFAAVRAATLALVRSLEAEAWSRRGVVNEKPIVAAALGYVLAGHTAHHLDVLRERYLTPR
jgi:hypothetical protein